MIKFKRNQGYTIIELMVVVGLTALLLVGVMGLFLTLLKGGGKAAAQAKVKEEADYAMITMERLIRDGSSAVCTSETSLEVTYPPSLNKPTTTYRLTADGVLSVDDGTATGPRYLTSDEVVISGVDVNGTYTLFFCDDGVVEIRFNIEDRGELVEDEFRARIILRNHD